MVVGAKDIMVDPISIAAGALSSSAVTNFLNPLFEKWKEKHKNDKNLQNFLSNSDERFIAYAKRMVEKYSYSKTIIFRRQQRKLESLYIPLTVFTYSSDIHNHYNDKSFFVIDDYKNDFIPNFKKILITDYAGMGKSTLMKWLFISCIKKTEAFPIFIELKNLKGDISIFDEICRELSDSFEEDKSFNKLIKKLISKGEFVFFFDGCDEINSNIYSTIINQLEEFISKSEKNLFIVSSRPDNSLSAFSSFTEFHIIPLKEREAFELIKKYDNNGEVSKKLISLLEKNDQKSIKEFLGNPLLTTLLYATFNYGDSLPSKKIDFYEQVYKALFEDHDLTKGPAYRHEKISNLDYGSFHKVLRYLGFLTARKGSVSYDKIELIELLNTIVNISDLNFSSENLLRDLIINVPIFVKDGNKYNWSHKSLQDFFASQYVYRDSKEKQKDYLLNMLKKCDKYFNILALYYETDSKYFEEVLVYQVITDFIYYCENTYKDLSSDFLPKDILEMQQLTFNREIYILEILDHNYDLLEKSDIEITGELVITSGDNHYVRSKIINYNKSVYEIRSQISYHNSFINLLDYINDEKFNKLLNEIDIRNDLRDVNNMKYPKLLNSILTNDPILLKDNNLFIFVKTMLKIVKSSIKIFNLDECIKLKKAIEKNRSNNLSIDEF